MSTAGCYIYQVRALEAMLEQTYSVIEEGLARLEFLVSSTLSELTNSPSYSDGRREAALSRLLPLRISINSLKVTLRYAHLRSPHIHNMLSDFPSARLALFILLRLSAFASHVQIGSPHTPSPSPDSYQLAKQIDSCLLTRIPFQLFDDLTVTPPTVSPYLHALHLYTIRQNPQQLARLTLMISS